MGVIVGCFGFRGFSMVFQQFFSSLKHCVQLTGERVFSLLKVCF